MNKANSQFSKTVDSNLVDSGTPWIGKVPSHWRMIPNKYCFQLQKDIVGARVDQYERLALTMSGVIKRSKEDNEGLQPTDFAGYQILKKNQLVFKLIDLNNVATSRVGLSPYMGIVSPAYIVLQCKENINERYAKYFFFMMYYGQIFNSLADNGVRANLGSWDLLNLPITVPPLSEQIEIADYLDKKCGLVDDVIFNLTNKIETLDKYKRSLIKEKVTTGFNNNDFVDSGAPWIGKIPRGWGVVKIGDIYQESNQQASARKHQPLSVTKMGILPQLENVAKTNDLDNRKLVLVNDFVINSRSDRKNSCGISQYEGSVSLINTVLEPIFLSNKMNNGYYNYVFHTMEFADEFYRWGHGIVDDLWTTRWREMKKIKLPFPPLSEQIEIADYLDKKCKLIDDIKSDIEKEIETLKEYKKSLIFECVTGKKVVSDE